MSKNRNAKKDFKQLLIDFPRRSLRINLPNLSPPTESQPQLLPQTPPEKQVSTETPKTPPKKLNFSPKKPPKQNKTPKKSPRTTRKPEQKRIKETNTFKISRFEPKQYKNWKKAKKKRWDSLAENPDRFYYHHKPPGAKKMRGDYWTKSERNDFIQKLKLHPVKRKQWGIFSLNIKGRTGKQCRSYYKKLKRIETERKTAKKAQRRHPPKKAKKEPKANGSAAPIVAETPRRAVFAVNILFDFFGINEALILAFPPLQTLSFYAARKLRTSLPTLEKSFAFKYSLLLATHRPPLRLKKRKKISAKPSKIDRISRTKPPHPKNDKISKISKVAAKLPKTVKIKKTAAEIAQNLSKRTQKAINVPKIPFSVFARMDPKVKQKLLKMGSDCSDFIYKNDPKFLQKSRNNTILKSPRPRYPKFGLPKSIELSAPFLSRGEAYSLPNFCPPPVIERDFAASSKREIDRLQALHSKLKLFSPQTGWGWAPYKAPQKKRRESGEEIELDQANADLFAYEAMRIEQLLRKYSASHLLSYQEVSDHMHPNVLGKEERNARKRIFSSVLKGYFLGDLDFS